MNNRPVSFPNWKQALASAALLECMKEAHSREILTFLKYCKTNHVGATTELAKHYLPERGKLGTHPAREALRWFYREGFKTQAAEQPASPDNKGSKAIKNSG